jgi:hypothetical protein
VFEAVLRHTDRPWTEGERAFLEKGADFLMKRKLMKGSVTKHNADERDDEPEWRKPCFPRFYFYDVLRGLSALLLWAEKTKAVIPVESVEEVVGTLTDVFRRV